MSAISSDLENIQIGLFALPAVSSQSSRLWDYVSLFFRAHELSQSVNHNVSCETVALKMRTMDLCICCMCLIKYNKIDTLMERNVREVRNI